MATALTANGAACRRAACACDFLLRPLPSNDRRSRSMRKCSLNWQGENTTMPIHRTQYRILQTAFCFALIGFAFFAAYYGSWLSQSAAGHHSDKKHPEFLSRAYFTEDPVAFATFGLAVFTALLFAATIFLALDGRKNSRAALDASTQQTATLIATERPYLTGGGGFRTHITADEEYSPTDAFSEHQKGTFVRKFQVTVANYGKTPALLTHYDVRFETLERVRTEHIGISKQYKHYDWLATGHENRKLIKEINIPEGMNVVFGGFWYLDFQKVEHCFQFILFIGSETTHPDIADEVDRGYTRWT